MSSDEDRVRHAMIDQYPKVWKQVTLVPANVGKKRRRGAAGASNEDRVPDAGLLQQRLTVAYDATATPAQLLRLLYAQLRGNESDIAQAQAAAGAAPRTSSKRKRTFGDAAVSAVKRVARAVGIPVSGGPELTRAEKIRALYNSLLVSAVPSAEGEEDRGSVDTGESVTPMLMTDTLLSLYSNGKAFEIAEFLCRAARYSAEGGPGGAPAPCTHQGLAVARNLVRNAATRIFADKTQSIVELVSNGIDASIGQGGSVGKFGFGFFSFMAFLYDNPRASIAVRTQRRNMPGVRVRFHVDITEAKVGARLMATVYVEPMSTKIGTRVVLQGFPKGTGKRFMQQMQRFRFYNPGRARIMLNRKCLNDRDSNGGSASTKVPSVEVTVTPNFVNISDAGTGMGLSEVFRYLLLPSVSSKGKKKNPPAAPAAASVRFGAAPVAAAAAAPVNAAPQKPRLLVHMAGLAGSDKDEKQPDNSAAFDAPPPLRFDEPMEPAELGENCDGPSFVVTVGGVVITELDLSESPDLPPVVVELRLPASQPVSIGRDQVILQPADIEALADALRAYLLSVLRPGSSVARRNLNVIDVGLTAYTTYAADKVSSRRLQDRLNTVLATTLDNPEEKGITKPHVLPAAAGKLLVAVRNTAKAAGLADPTSGVVLLDRLASSTAEMTFARALQSFKGYGVHFVNGNTTALVSIDRPAVWHSFPKVRKNKYGRLGMRRIFFLHGPAASAEKMLETVKESFPDTMFLSSQIDRLDTKLAEVFELARSTYYPTVPADSEGYRTVREVMETLMGIDKFYGGSKMADKLLKGQARAAEKKWGQRMAVQLMLGGPMIIAEFSDAKKLFGGIEETMHETHRTILGALQQAAAGIEFGKTSYGSNVKQFRLLPHVLAHGADVPGTKFSGTVKLPFKREFFVTVAHPTPPQFVRIGDYVGDVMDVTHVSDVLRRRFWGYYVESVRLRALAKSNNLRVSLKGCESMALEGLFAILAGGVFKETSKEPLLTRVLFWALVALTRSFQELFALCVALGLAINHTQLLAGSGPDKALHVARSLVEYSRSELDDGTLHAVWTDFEKLQSALRARGSVRIGADRNDANILTMWEPEVWNDTDGELGNLHTLNTLVEDVRKLVGIQSASLQGIPHFSAFVVPEPVARSTWSMHLSSLVAQLFKTDYKSNDVQATFDGASGVPALPLNVVSIAINEGTTKDVVRGAITEMVQNSMDACRQVGAPENCAVRLWLGYQGGAGGRESMRGQLRAPSNSGSGVGAGPRGLVVEVDDDVGMSVSNLPDLFVPYLSSKDPTDEDTTGEMGNGLFTVYRETSHVRVVTQQPGGKFIKVIDTPMRGRNGRATDLEKQISITDGDGSERGTTITLFMNANQREFSGEIVQLQAFAREQLALAKGVEIFVNGVHINHGVLRPDETVTSACWEMQFTVSERTRSFVLTKGVPYRVLQDMWTVLDVPSWMHDKVDRGVVLNLRGPCYSPTQSRTAMNVTTGALKELRELLANAVWRQGIHKAAELMREGVHLNSFLIEKYLTHFASTQDVLQLALDPDDKVPFLDGSHVRKKDVASSIAAFYTRYRGIGGMAHRSFADSVRLIENEKDGTLQQLTMKAMGKRHGMLPHAPEPFGRYIAELAANWMFPKIEEAKKRAERRRLAIEVAEEAKRNPPAPPPPPAPDTERLPPEPATVDQAIQQWQNDNALDRAPSIARLVEFVNKHVKAFITHFLTIAVQARVPGFTDQSVSGGAEAYVDATDGISGYYLPGQNIIRYNVADDTRLEWLDMLGTVVALEESDSKTNDIMAFVQRMPTLHRMFADESVTNTLVHELEHARTCNAHDAPNTETHGVQQYGDRQMGFEEAARESLDSVNHENPYGGNILTEFTKGMVRDVHVFFTDEEKQQVLSYISRETRSSLATLGYVIASPPV